jgi:hypothetical protein
MGRRPVLDDRQETRLSFDVALIELKTDPTPRELRMFALLWMPLFAGIVGVVLWRRGAVLPPAILWSGAALVAAVGAFRPRAIRPLFVGLIYLTAPIGWVVSHAVLALVYYGVVTPIGLLLRIFGRDAMKRGFDPRATSYFVPAEQGKKSEDYLRQF